MDNGRVTSEPREASTRMGSSCEVRAKDYRVRGRWKPAREQWEVKKGWLGWKREGKLEGKSRRKGSQLGEKKLGKKLTRTRCRIRVV